MVRRIRYVTSRVCGRCRSRQILIDIEREIVRLFVNDLSRRRTGRIIWRIALGGSCVIAGANWHLVLSTWRMLLVLILVVAGSLMPIVFGAVVIVHDCVGCEVRG